MKNIQIVTIVKAIKDIVGVLRRSIGNYYNDICFAGMKHFMNKPCSKVQRINIIYKYQGHKIMIIIMF